MAVAKIALLNSSLYLEEFTNKVADRTLIAGIAGLGYVGLPLAQLFHERGFQVLGLDIDGKKTAALQGGQSYIAHIPCEKIAHMREGDRFTATTDFSQVARLDVVSICVPTPLDKMKQPDLTAITQTCESIMPYLRPGQLIVLESTTYPGTTREVMVPILERSGLKAGVDFFVGYSPEREDPGNPDFCTRMIPKVVGANDDSSRKALEVFYGAVFDRVIPVTSCEAAEMVKLLENIYRCVNIALVNELKLLTQHMGLDVWEVIEAAATKPFGFQAFYPGPGLGGHCIPIDPFYLSWKAQEFDFTTRFIELAGEINTAMPYRVVERIIGDLNRRGIASKNANLLVLGIAYKKNVDDCRESPALKIMTLLADYGIHLTYFDPHVQGYVSHRYGSLAGKELTELTDVDLQHADATVILTDHDAFDYTRVVEQSQRVIDTRNATRNVTAHRERILSA